MFPLVPLKVDIDPEDSTTTSVSASWMFPGGIVESFWIECSNGTPSDSTIMRGSWNETDTYQYMVSCLDVTIPGNNYTMTVLSVSNDQFNSAEIILTACKELSCIIWKRKIMPSKLQQQKMQKINKNK